MRQATARPRPGTHRPPVQRAPAPRRVSGPARPAERHGPRPLPRPRPGPAPAAPPRRRSTTAFERIRALPDHRVVDRLLRSRLWIMVVGALLGGIVAMQVSLLKLNAGISRAVETSATLERQNGALEAAIARLGATERVRSTAETRGMVLLPAGEVDYLAVRPGDAARAAASIAPPTEAAHDLLANGGIVPGSQEATAAAGTAEGVADSVTDPAAATTEVVDTTVVDPAAADEVVDTTVIDPTATAATVE